MDLNFLLSSLLLIVRTYPKVQMCYLGGVTSIKFLHLFEGPLRILWEGRRTGDCSGEKRKRKRRTLFITELKPMAGAWEGIEMETFAYLIGRKLALFLYL